MASPALTIAPHPRLQHLSLSKQAKHLTFSFCRINIFFCDVAIEKAQNSPHIDSRFSIEIGVCDVT